MDSTILIIGAGTFGVSTAWHLSQNHSDPSKVTIIDRQASPPSLSAAADINRIFTADYSSPLYARLAKEALAFWAEDPDLEWYFHKVSRLVLDDNDDDDDNEGNRWRCEGAQRVGLEDLAQRWAVLDGTDMRAVKKAYIEPDAGWIDAATATWQFLETAVRRRVKREVGDVVELLLDRDARKIRGARTADGRVFVAETVVLAAGAWTSALLSPVEDALGVADEDRVEQQAQATAVLSASFPVSGEAWKAMAGCKMPCVVYGHVGEVVPPSRENKLLRYTDMQCKIINTVTLDSGRRVSVPPAKKRQDEVPQKFKVEMENRLTKRLMPRYTRGRPTWRMCWDNCTPTEDLLLCEHPRVKSLFIITGGSFNGYKFMPNIGKYMINILKRQSNGGDMDRAWGWKSKDELESAVHRLKKQTELNDSNSGNMSRL